jgi:hypothetical protein
MRGFAEPSSAEGSQNRDSAFANDHPKVNPGFEALHLFMSADERAARGSSFERDRPQGALDA